MIFTYVNLKFTDENQDELQAFLSWLNDTEGPIEIMLDSEGGHIHIALFVLKALNHHKDRLTLTAGYLQSSGMIVWLGYEGKVATTLLSQGMVHTGAVYPQLRDGNQTAPTQSRRVDELSRRMAWISENYCIPALEDYTLRAFKHHHDVWLGPEALDRIAVEKNRKLQEKNTNVTEKA